MNFNFAAAVTNSEHYYNCDTLYGHFYNLSGEVNRDPTWDNYSDLECLIDSSVNDWLFDKVSNTEEYVTTANGITC